MFLSQLHLLHLYFPQRLEFPLNSKTSWRKHGVSTPWLITVLNNTVWRDTSCRAYITLCLHVRLANEGLSFLFNLYVFMRMWVCVYIGWCRENDHIALLGRAVPVGVRWLHPPNVIGGIFHSKCFMRSWIYERWMIPWWEWQLLDQQADIRAPSAQTCQIIAHS